MTTEYEIKQETNEEMYAEAEAMAGEDYSGWSLFAGMMLFGVGLFSATAACAGFFNQSLAQDYSMVGNVFDWMWYGLFDGLTALVAFYAGYAVWSGKKIGYWLGLIISTLSAARWFLFIPGAPIWALTMVGIWLLTVYALIKDRESFS
jgi:hypothetical protein